MTWGGKRRKKEANGNEWDIGDGTGLVSPFGEFLMCQFHSHNSSTTIRYSNPSCPYAVRIITLSVDDSIASQRQHTDNSNLSPHLARAPSHLSSRPEQQRVPEQGGKRKRKRKRKRPRRNRQTDKHAHSHKSSITSLPHPPFPFLHDQRQRLSTLPRHHATPGYLDN